MALKQNKDKTAEEKVEETKFAEEQLGIELETLFDDTEEKTMPSTQLEGDNKE